MEECARSSSCISNDDASRERGEIKTDKQEEEEECLAPRRSERAGTASERDWLRNTA